MEIELELLVLVRFVRDWFMVAGVCSESMTHLLSYTVDNCKSFNAVCTSNSDSCNRQGVRCAICCCSWWKQEKGKAILACFATRWSWRNRKCCRSLRLRLRPIGQGMLHVVACCVTENNRIIKRMCAYCLHVAAQLAK